MGELVCLCYDRHRINSSFLTHLVASSKWTVAQEMPHASSVPPALDMQDQVWATDTFSVSVLHASQVQEQAVCDVFRMEMPYLLRAGNIWRSCLVESWSPRPVVSEELEEQDHWYLCPAHPA